MSRALPQTILLPLDGSPRAEAALGYAANLSKKVNAELVLLRSALAHELRGISPASAQVRVVAQAETYLGSIEQKLKETGVRCRSVVPYGPAAETIVDNARLQSADLVIMSAQGHSGHERWTQGGVADKVVRGLKMPVLLVRGEGRTECDAGGCGNILLPLDGSELAESVLPRVVGLAKRLDLGVSLLAVVTGPASYDAEDYLLQVSNWLRTRDIASRTEVVQGEAADAIIECGQSPEIAFTALSAHGQSGADRWEYGRVAERVVSEAESPVLLFRLERCSQANGRAVMVKRCHNCGREVFRETFSPNDTCPRCGYTLRACSNCKNYDGVMCSLENPWGAGIYVGTNCADFSFREKVEVETEAQKR